MKPHGSVTADMTASGQPVCFLGPFRSEAIAGRFGGAARESLRQFPGTGGSGLVALTRARLAAGLPTEIITLDPRLRADAPVVCETEGLKYTICPRRPRHVVRDLFRLERRRLADAVADSRAPLLHAHWTYEYALAAIDSGRPALITARDHTGRILRHEGPRFLGHYLMARMAFRRHRFFSAVSPDVAGYVGRHVRRPVPVIGNPMPFEADAAQSGAGLPFADGRCVIVSAASWARFKNIREALRAFALFRREAPDAVYRLFGPGLEPNGAAECWASRRGLKDGVEFCGIRPHSEIVRAFQECDLAWHPSLEDACPNPVLEALASAKPVVASRQASGSRWLIEHERTGILADGKSHTSMAAALADLCRRPGRSAELARRGRQSVGIRFAPAVILEAYEKVYRRIIQSCGEARDLDNDRQPEPCDA